MKKPSAMQARLRLSRRSRICGRQVKITQKPSAMQARLQSPKRKSINAEGKDMKTKAFWPGAAKIAAAGLLYC